MVFRQMPTVLSWIGGPASSASNWPRSSRIEAEQSSISLTMKELADRIIRRVTRCATALSPLRTISSVTGSTPGDAVRGCSVGVFMFVLHRGQGRRDAGCFALPPAGQVRVEHLVEAAAPARRQVQSGARVFDDGRAGKLEAGLQRRQAMNRRCDTLAIGQQDLTRLGARIGNRPALDAGPVAWVVDPCCRHTRVDKLQRSPGQVVAIDTL